MNCYTYIKQRASFNVGVAFFILLLFASNSFSLSIVSSVSVASSPRCYIGGSNWFRVSCSVGGGQMNNSCGGSRSVPSGYAAAVVSSSVSVFACGIGNICDFDGPGGTCYLPPVNTGGESAAFGTCVCNFTLTPLSPDVPPFLPSCSDPAPISAPQCNGGQGLLTTVTDLIGTQNLLSAYGQPEAYGFIGGVNYWHWNDNAVGATAHATTSNIIVNSDSTKYTAVRPDGSQCDLFSSGVGKMYDFVTCPLGLNLDGLLSSSSEQSSSSEAPTSSSSEGYSSGGGQSSSSGADLCDEFPTLPYCECQRNPSLPWCSGAGSSGSNNGGQSSDSGFDLCRDFPHLIFCQQSSDSGGGSSSPSGGSSNSSGGTNDGGLNFGSGNGGTTGGNGEGSTTCLTNNNCNWARIDVQLTQLGVETQTRDYVRDIAALQSAGYNLTNEQNILLHSVLQAVNSGNANVVGALNDLASAVNAGNSANSDNFNSSLTAWQDMLNNTFGTNGSKLDNTNNKLDSLKVGLSDGVADGVADGLGKFAGDTAGTGEFNNSLSEYGKGSGSAMGDSLGNGTVARNKIKQAIKIDSTSFSFLGSSGSCPVWDLSFNAGIVSCNSCKIDLCNVYGFNAGQVIRAIIWLIALVSVLFMNLQVLKTGGH